MIVQTPRCVVCGNTAFLEVEAEGFARWIGGMYVQDALPTLTDDQRELLLSGTHAHCWATLWPEEDDDDDT